MVRTMGLPTFALPDDVAVTSWRETLLSRGFQVILDPGAIEQPTSDSPIQSNEAVPFIIRSSDSEILVIEARVVPTTGRSSQAALVFVPPRLGKASLALQRQVMDELTTAGFTRLQ
jgi:hypothetical protein